MGLRFEDKLTDSNLGYRLYSGVTSQKIKLIDNNDDVIENSGFDLGFDLGYEIGAALTIDLTPTFRLTPGISYRSLDQTMEINGVNESVDLDSTVFDIGAAWLF